MLTLFAVPKAFQGSTGTIQRNAIRSWTLLRPSPEIILFGNDSGTAEIAREFGLRHFPDVTCNNQRTPLVSDLFLKAQELAEQNRLCYVNSDIILLNDFMPSIRNIQMSRFLLVGRRWNLDLSESVDFSKGWEERLRNLLKEKGEIHPPTGMDYFVFSRGLYREIPRFAIGRTSWDNWLIYRARALKIPVIDATRAITVVHQNHGYEHHPGGSDGVWKGREAELNLELAGGSRYLFTLRDATFLLTPGGRLHKPALTKSDLLRRIEVRMILHRAFEPIGKTLLMLLTPAATLRRGFQKLTAAKSGGV